MALFENHSPRVRQMIAFAITAGVALVLIALLIVVYSSKKPLQQNDSGSKLKSLYNTILENGQSVFGTK